MLKRKGQTDLWMAEWMNECSNGQWQALWSGGLLRSELGWTEWAVVEKPDTVDSYGLCRAVLERMGSAIRLITLSTFSMDGFMADICSFRFLVKAASVGSCFWNIFQTDGGYSKCHKSDRFLWRNPWKIGREKKKLPAKLFDYNAKVQFNCSKLTG